jgi:riboflavin transporter FmnP
MDTKRISLIAIFAALTIVLSPTISRISIPSFFPGLQYNFFELPIVIALLLLGLKPGVAVGLIASIALLPLHQTYIAIWGIVAWMSMLAGVYVGYRLVNRNAQQEKMPSARKTVLFCTAGAIILRTLFMAIQNYTLLRYPVIGMNLPESTILMIIPPIALFNATQPLFVVPLGYFLARTIGSNLKIGNRI